MNQQLRKQTSTHDVAVVTPLHVGTGENLIKNVDFRVQGNVVQLPDLQHFFAELEQIAYKKDLTAELKGDTLKLDRLINLVKSNGGNVRSRFSYNLTFLDAQDVNNVKGDIREQIKDGFRRPIIPGSSVKGAMRTALLVDLIAKTNSKFQPPYHGSQPKDKDADDKFMAGLFASEALDAKDVSFFDLLRSLQVSDVTFERGDLSLFDVRWLNVGEAPLETKWGQRQRFFNWSESDSVAVEGLKPDGKAQLTLGIDNFLLHNPQARQVLKWDISLIPKDFAEWRMILNQHAIMHLQEEIAFLHECGADNVAQEHKVLLKIIQADVENAYVRVGWGNGWKGMTGDWLDEATLSDIRELYSSMGTGKVFPKTRRLVVQNGSPCLPFGWLKIFPARH